MLGDEAPPSWCAEGLPCGTTSSCVVASTSAWGLLVAADVGGGGVLAGDGQASLPSVERGAVAAVDLEGAGDVVDPRLEALPLRPADARDILSLFFTVSPSTLADRGSEPTVPPFPPPVAVFCSSAVVAAVRAALAPAGDSLP